MTGDLMVRAAKAEILAATLAREAAQLRVRTAENVAATTSRHKEFRSLSEVTRAWLAKLHATVEEADRCTARLAGTRACHPHPGLKIVVGNPVADPTVVR